MVLGARRDGAKAGEVKAKAPIVLKAALMQSAPAPVDAPEVGQMRGGTTDVSLADVAMARTLEPELPASSTIEGSAPEGAPVTEEVPSAPIGPTLTVARADPSVGARPSRSLVRSGDDPLTWGRNRLHWARRLDPSHSVFTLDD